MDAFADVSANLDALAASNYAIGVCTPVSLGAPSSTIRIDMNGTVVEQLVPYSTDLLTGDLGNCDATLVSGITSGFVRLEP